MVSQIQPPKTQMNPTLADLINEALDARALRISAENSLMSSSFQIESAQESDKLASNALEERFQSMIDERITQMLKELRP